MVVFGDEIGRPSGVGDVVVSQDHQGSCLGPNPPVPVTPPTSSGVSLGRSLVVPTERPKETRSVFFYVFRSVYILRRNTKLN